MVILFNLVALLGCVLSCILNVPIMVIGRFLYGFACGVIVCATPKILEETIPAHAMDNGYGVSTNLAINLFICVSLILGAGMPDTTSELQTTNFWRVIFLVPVPIIIISILLNIYVHTEDSLSFHIQRGQKEQAMAMIVKIYPS